MSKINLPDLTPPLLLEIIIEVNAVFN